MLLFVGLCFFGCIDRTVFQTQSAVDAEICVNCINGIPFANRLRRTFFCTQTACDTTIIYYVRHFFLLLVIETCKATNLSQMALPSLVCYNVITKLL
jgi:hypothetical protein